MRVGFASFLVLLAVAPLATGRPGDVVLRQDLPDYCIYTQDPFIGERGSDGSCGADAMEILVNEMNRAWCEHVAPCPGGHGPFDYHRPWPLP